MVKYIIWQPLFMTNQQTRTKQTKEAENGSKHRKI